MGRLRSGRHDRRRSEPAVAVETVDGSPPSARAIRSSSSRSVRMSTRITACSAASPLIPVVSIPIALISSTRAFIEFFTARLMCFAYQIPILISYLCVQDSQ